MKNAEGGLRMAERGLGENIHRSEPNEADSWHQTFGLFGLEGHGAGAVTCFLRWLQRVAQNGSRREAC